MLVHAAWAVEYLLEITGAFLSFRQKYRSLGAMLTFCAVSDSVLTFLHGDAYGYAWWGSQAIQYVFLTVIGCQLAAKMLAERGPISAHASFIVVGIGAIVSLIAHRAETWPDQFLDGMISASCLVPIILAAAYVTRKRDLGKIDVWIAAGVLTAALGNALCGMVWKYQLGAGALVLIPGIASAGLWNLAFVPSELAGMKIRRLAAD